MPPPAFGNRWRHRGGRAPARFAVTRPRELLGQGYVLVAVSAWQWEDGSWHDMVVLDRQGVHLGVGSPWHAPRGWRQPQEGQREVEAVLR